jgi:hypothetical protein
VKLSTEGLLIFTGYVLGVAGASSSLEEKSSKKTGGGEMD